MAAAFRHSYGQRNGAGGKLIGFRRLWILFYKDVMFLRQYAAPFLRRLRRGVENELASRNVAKNNPARLRPKHTKYVSQRLTSRGLRRARVSLREGDAGGSYPRVNEKGKLL